MIYEKDGFYFGSFENHHALKPILLHEIEKDIKKYKLDQTGRAVTALDFYLDKKHPRSYAPYVKEHLFPDIRKYFYSKFFMQANFSVPWFHRYIGDGRFGWHDHGKASLVLVYYLELPSPSNATKFLDREIEVKEGDFILFPGWIPHCSLKVPGSKYKTIISCNITFTIDKKAITNKYPV